MLRWIIAACVLLTCSATHAATAEQVRACNSITGICIYMMPELYDASKHPPTFPMPPEDFCEEVQVGTQAVLRKWPVKQVWHWYWWHPLESGRYPTCDQ
jgi:hypothetical protein